MLEIHYCMLGYQYQKNGEYDEAIICYAQAYKLSQKTGNQQWVEYSQYQLQQLGMNPNNDSARNFYKWGDLAYKFSQLARWEETVFCYDILLELSPYDSYFWCSRGNILSEKMQRYEEAIANYDQALELRPNDYYFWYSRGNILCEHLQRYEEAVANYDRALSLEPDNYYNYAVWYNRSYSLVNLCRWEDVITSYDQALAFKLDWYEVWELRGCVLADKLHRYEEAIASFDRALELNPNYELAHNNRSIALIKLIKNLARHCIQFLPYHAKTRVLNELNSDQEIELRNFMSQVLHAIRDSDCDPQFMYVLLKTNLDKLSDNFAQMWREWAMGMLSQVESIPLSIVGDIFNFSNQILSEFPQESRASKIEIAIANYELLLAVVTSEVFQASPEVWFSIQKGLGDAYLQRIRGDQAENIDMTIRCFEAVLPICTCEVFPKSWAMIQDSLGYAYCKRIQGNKQENLKQAIQFHKAALQIYTREKFPEEWANTHNNLGTAYKSWVLEDKSENIERQILYYLENLQKAICYYELALQIYTYDAFPKEWAMTKSNLGGVYCLQYIFSKKADKLEQALCCLEAALEVHTREDFPESWAMTQNNLASVYREQGQIPKAIECLRLALKIHTPVTNPVECLRWGQKLGSTAFHAGQWLEAIEGYTIAIEAVEQSREWASTDQRKQEILSDAIDVYANMVQTCININQIDKAIEYADRSKTRNLVELLATRDLYPKGDIPETVINELSRLRREIDAEQRRLDNQQTNRNSNGGTISGERSLQIDTLQTTSRDSTNLTQLRQQLDELLVRDIQPIDPDFLLTQKVKGISYSDIQALTTENTAIIQWYILGDKFLTFIITSQSPTPIVSESSKADFQALVNWREEYLRDYQKEDKTQWRENLAPRLQSLSEILHLNEIIERVPTHCKQLILIPHRFLHLFPLHALPVSYEIWKQFNSETQSPEPTNPCLLDCFKQGVRYAPSCQLLQQAQRRKRPNFTHLFAVQNPTNDLQFTDLEVPAISQHFHPKDILVKSDAKKSVIDDRRLRIAHCAHFSCHGYFNFKQPLLSALLLADSELPPPPPEENPTRYLPLRNGKTLDLTKCLTLADIFALDFRECRLVVLSACETGISDFNSISDEYISLPSGFLVAGSSSVVPTLWAVNDLSTSFLMIKFYQLLKAGLSVTIALNTAQLWLRDATTEKLQEWTSQLPLRLTQKEALYDMLDDIDSKEIRPFQSPYHWAAFCSVGQ